MSEISKKIDSAFRARATRRKLLRYTPAVVIGTVSSIYGANFILEGRETVKNAPVDPSADELGEARSEITAFNKRYGSPRDFAFGKDRPDTSHDFNNPELQEDYKIIEQRAAHRYAVSSGKLQIATGVLCEVPGPLALAATKMISDSTEEREARLASLDEPLTT